MYYWRDNKGNIFGPFNKQADGFPNAGEVVRHYRVLMGITQVMLAEKLNVTPLWVINMENHNKVPQNLSRRRVIADLLKIPPALLGIYVIGSDIVLKPLEESAPAHASVSAYSIEEANDYLNAAWEALAFTGSRDVLLGVRRQKVRIKEQVARGGPEQRKYLALLHRYEHLLLEDGGQRQDYTGTEPIGLIDLARQIENPDALSTSLYHRSKMYFYHKSYKEALEDMQEALKVVEHAGPQVKGVTLVGSGPILAYYATDKSDVSKVLKNLDAAWKCVDPAKSYPDPFYRGFDESWYFLARAAAVLALLRLDPNLLNEVWEALALAQERTKPTYVQRRANIELSYAEAAFYTAEYSSATNTALEALELACSINSVKNIKRIRAIYEKLNQTKIKDSAELRMLGVALSRK